MITTKVQKWGNSLAVRIPKSIADACNFTEGASVGFVPSGNGANLYNKKITNNKKGSLADIIDNYIIPTGKPMAKKSIVDDIDKIVYGVSR